MFNNFFRRLAACVISTSFILPSLTILPLSETTAETDKDANEIAYAEVLNTYVEKVIPGKLDNGRDELHNWAFSDMWMPPSAKNTSDFGYKFYDLNCDGIDELFIIDLRFADQYGIHVNEIYTLSNGIPKQITTGGARWNYYVVDSENVLGEIGSGGAYTHGYTYYHLIDSELVAFETYTHDNGTWYFAEGEGCLNIPMEEMQIITEDKVYSEHHDTIGGIEALIFDEGYYLFSDYKVKDTQSNIAGNKCGDNAYWTLDEDTGTLTISGTGPMYDYDAIGSNGNYAPWFIEKSISS